MQRVAFMMRIKPGTEEEYERRHQAVWPELLAAIREVGIRNYSIYRRGQDLFAYMEVEDYERAMADLGSREVTKRWQEYMAPLFETAVDVGSEGGMVILKEVFHTD